MQTKLFIKQAQYVLPCIQIAESKIFASDGVVRR